MALAGDRLGDRNVETGRLWSDGLGVSSGPVDIESPDSMLGEVQACLSGSSGLFNSLLLRLSNAIELPSSSDDEFSSGVTGVFPFTWSSIAGVVLALRRLKLNLLNFIDKRDRGRVGLISSTISPCS